MAPPPPAPPLTPICHFMRKDLWDTISVHGIARLELISNAAFDVHNYSDQVSLIKYDIIFITQLNEV